MNRGRGQQPKMLPSAAKSTYCTSTDHQSVNVCMVRNFTRQNLIWITPTSDLHLPDLELMVADTPNSPLNQINVVRSPWWSLVSTIAAYQHVRVWRQVTLTPGSLGRTSAANRPPAALFLPIIKRSKKLPSPLYKTPHERAKHPRNRTSWQDIKLRWYTLIIRKDECRGQGQNLR